MKQQKKKILLSSLTVATFLIGTATTTASKTDTKSNLQNASSHSNMIKLARGVQANCCSSSKCDGQLS